jgi:hypothetical protein
VEVVLLVVLVALDGVWSVLEVLVEDDGVWLVVSAGVVGAAPVVEQVAPALPLTPDWLVLVSVPVVPVVDVAVPVVPPVVEVDVVEDWLFMSVPLAPVGVPLEPVVPAFPVELWLASGT